MVNVLARAGSVLGAAAAACAMAFAGGGLPAWMAVALCAGLLALAGAVLFWPTETPARRLTHLIQAWRGSSPPRPDQPSNPPARQRAGDSRRHPEAEGA
ncbi:hypothetical protein [Streptomyces sp. NPDC001914]|uniref:hypothetical protein n=1 Tax=Streptomyces sp. NPDC001914 TaxID=3364623 RepID=UPI0036B32DB2